MTERSNAALAALEIVVSTLAKQAQDSNPAFRESAGNAGEAVISKLTDGGMTEEFCEQVRAGVNRLLGDHH